MFYIIGAIKGISILTDIQDSKFMTACNRIELDNPSNTMEDHLKAAKIYLKFIIDFPDLSIDEAPNSVYPSR